MPAINLARLKIQSAQLVEHFSDAATFIHRLHDLLNHYANRAYRPGQAGKPPPLLANYNIPAPVLRQIAKDLYPYTIENPQAALNLADALWEQPFLEFRLLAIAILGKIRPNPPQMVTERVQRWAKPEIEDRLLDALLSEGLARVRREYLDLYIDMLAAWCDSKQYFYQKVGIRASSILVQEQGFDNLPLVFRMISPFVKAAQSELRTELLDVLQVLARRTPNETAYFLSQSLSWGTESPGIVWLIRHSLRYFPQEVQVRLRGVLREEFS